MIEIPLRDRRGACVAIAVVDDEDGHLAEHAWYRDSDGYAIRRLNWVGGRSGRRPVMRLHRAVLGLADGDRREGDHINRDKLDNRRSNLRITTRAENGQNVPGRGSSSQRGVSWRKAHQRWVVVLRADGKRKYLGSFRDEADAVAVAQAFIAQHQPFDCVGVAT